MAANLPPQEAKACSEDKKSELSIIHSCDTQHVVVYFKVSSKSKKSNNEDLPLLYLHKDCLPGRKCKKEFLTKCPHCGKSFKSFSSSYAHVFGDTRRHPTKKRVIANVLEIKDDGRLENLGNPFDQTDVNSTSDDDPEEDLDNPFDFPGKKDAKGINSTSVDDRQEHLDNPFESVGKKDSNDVNTTSDDELLEHLMNSVELSEVKDPAEAIYTSGTIDLTGSDSEDMADEDEEVEDQDEEEPTEEPPSQSLLSGLGSSTHSSTKIQDRLSPVGTEIIYSRPSWKVDKLSAVSPVDSRQNQGVVIIFGIKDPPVGKLRCILKKMRVSKHTQCFYWPGELTTGVDINEAHMMGVFQEVLTILKEKPAMLLQVIKPTVNKADSWYTVKGDYNPTSSVKSVQQLHRVEYVASDENGGENLIVAIDETIDKSGEICETVKQIFEAKERENQDLEKATQMESVEEQFGGDTLAVEEDEGELPEKYKNSNLVEDLPAPAYYPTQEFLAEIVVKRIEKIYQYHHKIRNISKSNATGDPPHFKNFDFRIYTANSNMLLDQTLDRVSRRDSMCFPEDLYIGSDRAARLAARDKVMKYMKQTVDTSHKELMERVKKESDTLFLIVADEAHWGATEKDQANSRLVNDWTSEDHPNVIVLLVTATPYNLLTANTRLPEFLYEDREDGELIAHDSENELRGKDQRYLKKLHHIRWTESYNARVQQGIVVKLRVPVRGKDRNPAFLCMVEAVDQEKLSPWKGVDNISDDSKYEFLIKGEANDVVISTTDGKWRLAAGKTQVGFICSSDAPLREFTTKFTLLSGYGEGVMLVKVNRPNSKDYLCYDKDNKKIIVKHHRQDFRTVSSYEIPPLENSFIIEESRPAKQIGPAREYVSLNYYINSMRNEYEKDRLIRQDDYFQQMTRALQKHHDNLIIDDILTAEYSYYILLINLLRKCCIQAPSVEKCFQDLVGCTNSYSEWRECTYNYSDQRDANIETFIRSLKKKKVPTATLR